MKLDLDPNTNPNTINAYSESGIEIGGKLYINNLLLSDKNIFDNWQANPVNELTLEDFSLLFADKPEVLILGTGANMQFPSKSLYVELASQGIGLEVMDTEAACRTFNVLLSEGRAVAGAMYLDQ